MEKSKSKWEREVKTEVSECERFLIDFDWMSKDFWYSSRKSSQVLRPEHTDLFIPFF